MKKDIVKKFFFLYFSICFTIGAIHKVCQHFWGGEGYLECWRLLTWGRGVFEMLTSAFLSWKTTKNWDPPQHQMYSLMRSCCNFFLFCAIKQCNHVIGFFICFKSRYILQGEGVNSKMLTYFLGGVLKCWRLLTWGRGVSKLAEKVLTYFMDGPNTL